ncbi:MAG TPA: hypothetical protein VFI15_03155, partial [Candidatus Limnocylindrales bacterium]|nr:hypothetical protein [Candidatus Limnocylindrales bacterium]
AMSDEGTFAAPAAAPANGPTSEQRTCPWCAAPAHDDATTCTSCGAALAQRESLGDVRIPGLTAVDPALTDYASRPMHLHGPSASQGAAPALIVGAAAGGPIGAVLIGGVVAVAAAEYLGAKQPGISGAALENVGRPSELALKALEHVDATTNAGATPDPTANPAADCAAPAVEPAEPDAAEPVAAAAEGGMSIWRDLPSPSAD